MSKKKQRREDALREAVTLKASRRKEIITCALALAAIIIIVGVKTYLTAVGILASEDTISNSIVMFAAIGLAILGGRSSINFTKAGRRITELKESCNIDNQDIKDYREASH